MTGLGKKLLRVEAFQLCVRAVSALASAAVALGGYVRRTAINRVKLRRSAANVGFEPGADGQLDFDCCYLAKGSFKFKESSTQPQ